jgi:hypothetical protein
MALRTFSEGITTGRGTARAGRDRITAGPRARFQENRIGNRGVAVYGGPGSGHFGHAGRSGRRGGSKPGKGTAGAGYQKKLAAFQKKAGISKDRAKELWKDVRNPIGWENIIEKGNLDFKDSAITKKEAAAIKKLGQDYFYSEAGSRTVRTLPQNRNPRVPAGDNYHPSVGWY